MQCFQIRCSSAGYGDESLLLATMVHVPGIAAKVFPPLPGPDQYQNDKSGI